MGIVCLRSEGKTLLGDINNVLKIKSLLTIAGNVLPYTSSNLSSPCFEFSLKVRVMASNAGCLAKSCFILKLLLGKGLIHRNGTHNNFLKCNK